MHNAGSRPIVCFSLGDSCLFRFGNGESRTGEHQDTELKSGEIFVIRGAARMAFYGVLKVYPQTAPPELGMRAGRLSITIRETGFSNI